MCRDGDPDNATHQIATLVLAGPEGDNTASCFKNQHSCAVRLREIRTTGGQNHLRIMPSCEDYELTPPGFVEGAVAVADETSFWYEMSNTDKMRLEAAGIYKLCWCHSFSPSDCTQLSDFNVEAGSFIYAGPYEVVSLREVRISQVGSAWPMDQCTSQVEDGFQVWPGESSSRVFTADCLLLYSILACQIVSVSCAIFPESV